MAKNKSLEWFRHDVNASTTLKMKKILAKHGNQGYAVVYRLMEMLGNEKQMQADQDSIEFLAIELSTRNDEVSPDVVHDILYNSDFFEVEETMFSSPEINDSIQEMNKRSEIYRKNAQKGVEAKKHKKQDDKQLLNNSRANAKHITSHNKTSHNKTSHNKTSHNITNITTQEKTKQDQHHLTSQDITDNGLAVEEEEEGMNDYFENFEILEAEQSQHSESHQSATYPNFTELKEFVQKEVHKMNKTYATDELIQTFCTNVSNHYNQYGWVDAQGKPIEHWKAFIRSRIQNDHILDQKKTQHKPTSGQILDDLFKETAINAFTDPNYSYDENEPF